MIGALSRAPRLRVRPTTLSETAAAWRRAMATVLTAILGLGERSGLPVATPRRIGSPASILENGEVAAAGMDCPLTM